MPVSAGRLGGKESVQAVLAQGGIKAERIY